MKSFKVPIVVILTVIPLININFLHIVFAKDYAQFELMLDEEITTSSSDSKIEAPDIDAEIDSMPILLKFVKSDYPADLIRAGIEGTVVLDLLINEKGMVDSVAVVKGIHRRLDSLAAEAARHFEFRPAIAQGIAVAVILQYEYRFSLDMVTTKVEKYVNFSGRVVERGTKEPLMGALVCLTFLDTMADTSIGLPFSLYLKKISEFPNQSYESGSKIVSVTDSNGHFEFYSLPNGPVEVRIIAEGCEILSDNETIKPAEHTQVIYRLTRRSYGDYEIVVYGKAQQKEVSRHTLTLNEVKKVPGLGADAVKVVQLMPGVARPIFGGGEIIVRGTGTSESRYYLDGVELPALYHFGGLKSTYNSDALESVDFYPGGFGVRYGGAIGGIVELKGRPPRDKRWHGYADVNLFDASLLAEGPLVPRMSFLLSLRRSYVADVMNYIITDIVKKNLPFTVVPYYWDYIARVDIKAHSRHDIFATAFGAKDKLEMLVAQARGGSTDIDKQTNMANYELKFKMGLLGWNWNIVESIRNELRYGIIDGGTDVSIFGFFKYRGSGINHYIRNQLTLNFSPNLKAFGGIDINIYPIDIHISASISDTIVNYNSREIFGPYGFYSSIQWSALNALSLIGGIRYDYYPELRHKGSIIPEFWQYKLFNNRKGPSAEPSIRLTARYTLNKNHTVKAAIGNYNETPQPIGQSISTMVGNPYLSTTKAAHYVAGYEFQINDLWLADIQSYFNNQFNMARQPTMAEKASNPKIENYIDDQKGRAMGLEILLRRNHDEHSFGWIAYSFARAQRFDIGSNKWLLYDRDITHNLQLVGSWKLPKKFEIGLRGRFTSGYPTTPILGTSYYDESAFRYVPLYGQPNSQRMAPYISADARAERKFIFDTWIMTLYADFINIGHIMKYVKINGRALYESPEIGGYIWNYDYTEKRVLSDIPRASIGAKVEF